MTNSRSLETDECRRLYQGAFQYAVYVRAVRNIFPNASRFAELSLGRKLRDGRGMVELFAQVGLANFLMDPFLCLPTFYLCKELATVLQKRSGVGVGGEGKVHAAATGEGGGGGGVEGRGKVADKGGERRDKDTEVEDEREVRAVATSIVALAWGDWKRNIRDDASRVLLLQKQ